MSAGRLCDYRKCGQYASGYFRAVYNGVSSEVVQIGFCPEHRDKVVAELEALRHGLKSSGVDVVFTEARIDSTP